MTKVIKLKESDIQHMVNRVLTEQEENEFCSKFPNSVYGERVSSNQSSSIELAEKIAIENLKKKLNNPNALYKVVEQKTFMRGSNYITKVCVEEDV